MHEREEGTLSTVLVTGGSGFIAAHCIQQLLAAGYRVRATVRSLTRESEVRALVPEGGTGGRLTVLAANLESDAGWNDAVSGCDYVLHVASPFPAGVPDHADDLIVPAREGALRVLRAARDAGVKRVVLTSSFAAIGYGYPERQTPFDETCWSNIDGRASAYVKSKTLAERAAWKFIADEGGAVELAVVNPVLVVGPVLGPDISASIQVIQRLMNGGMPGAPRLYFGVVDVRDVAALHLLAMQHPAAKGERFLCAAGDFMSLLDIARVVRRRLGAAGKRAPARELPNWFLRAAALFNPAAREILPELGKRKNGSSAKARNLLGWTARSNEDAIVASGESLLRFGLVGHCATPPKVL
jgi:nucleoside-diphosphate-sugar epimerase